MTDRSHGGFSQEAEAAAAELLGYASALARERGISPFVIPEILLLAAIEGAARIDGTAEGTIDWIRNVAARLGDPEDVDHTDVTINRAS